MKWTNLNEELLTEAKIAKNEAEARAWIRNSGAAVSDLKVNSDGSIECGSFTLHGDPTIRRLGVKIVKAEEINLSHCNFDDLVGCPETVQTLVVSGKIKSLKGCPKEVTFNFSIRATNLEDLSDGPQVVGYFVVEHNSQLKSLKGGPKEVTISMDVINCPALNTFDGFPTAITNKLAIVKIKSDLEKTLSGIFKIKHLKRLVISNHVNENIIGLTQIEGLDDVELDGFGRTDDNLIKALKIVKKYWGGKDAKKARDCQREMIDADLDDFAAM